LKRCALHRDDLVYDGRAIPDDVIRTRFESSIDREVVANPPLRRRGVCQR